MDPNANLEEQRIIAARITRAHDAGRMADSADVDRLAELALALDGWIASGGYLPRDWQVR